MTKIVVTQDDIDAANAHGLQGARCNGAECPVNRAAERAFGVGCRTQRSYIIVGATNNCAWLPQIAREFIYRFDMGHADLVKPFEFEVEVTPGTPIELRGL